MGPSLLAGDGQLFCVACTLGIPLLGSRSETGVPTSFTSGRLPLLFCGRVSVGSLQSGQQTRCAECKGGVSPWWADREKPDPWEQIGQSYIREGNACWTKRDTDALLIEIS